MPKLKPYPKYKPSGIQWLGDIPQHWQVRRIKYLLSEANTRSVDGSETLLSVSQYTGVTERGRSSHEDAPDTRAESLIGYKCVEPEDLVVNIMLAWNGGMGISKFRGIASPAYCVYRFNRDAHPWYFHYLLRSYIYKAWIKAISTGVVESRLRMYTDDFYRLEALLPPLAEQRAIARYLDHITSRIDTYTSNKRKLVELLKEYRQALIHQTVTRGLNPDVKLKPSGIQWLGDIPSHWQVMKLRHILTNVRTERNRPDLPLLSVVREKGVILRDTTSKDENHNFIPEDLSNYKVVRKGQFAMNKMKAWQGSYGVSQHTGIVSPAYFVFDINRISADYFHIAVRSKSCVPFFAQASDGVRTDQWDLSQTRMKEIPIPLPPIEEQRAIADYLDRKTDKIDTAIDLTQREIELLEEYRTRLIADIVTGQLDVRESKL